MTNAATPIKRDLVHRSRQSKMTTRDPKSRVAEMQKSDRQTSSKDDTRTEVDEPEASQRQGSNTFEKNESVTQEITGEKITNTASTQTNGIDKIQASISNLQVRFSTSNAEEVEDPDAMMPMTG